MDKAKIKTILQKEFKGLKNSGKIVSIISSPENYNDVVKISLSLLTKAKSNGVYVSLNKGAESIGQDLKKDNISISRLYFIDASGSKCVNKDNVFCVQGPKALTEISLATMASIDTGKFEFLFLDSLSTLLIYNDLKTTEKFAHFVMNKLKGFSMVSLIIALNEEDSKQLVSVVSQLSDKVVKIE